MTRPIISRRDMLKGTTAFAASSAFASVTSAAPPASAVTPQLIDLRAGLADHDAGPRRVDVDLHLGGVLADRDVRQPGVREPSDDVLADLGVLVQEVREVALVEPVGLPVVDVAHADRFGVNFLTHVCLSPLA